MVLLGAIALTVAIGDHADSVVIALVILVNTAVGVIQEIRADHEVAALSAMSRRMRVSAAQAPKARRRSASRRHPGAQ